VSSIYLQIADLTAGSVLFTSCSDTVPLPFDSTQWKSSVRFVQGRMTGHLMYVGLLIGKSKSEVLEMLGTSNSKLLWILQHRKQLR
jgi:hypothetical protein